MRPIIGVNGGCLWPHRAVCHSFASIPAPRSHGKPRGTGVLQLKPTCVISRVLFMDKPIRIGISAMCAIRDVNRNIMLAQYS